MRSRAITVFIGFVVCATVATGIGFMLPKRDLLVECKQQCGFRHHRLVADSAWGKNKSGDPARFKCECF
jgi:hypothetical protein